MSLYWEPVDFHCPVLEENRFTKDELEELFSFIESGDSVVSPNSSSEGSSRVVSSTESERKLEQRKISNRNSARRSRLRKKKHLEDLKDQVKRSRTHNVELKNRLGSALHLCHVVRSQNEMLRSEYMALSATLTDLDMILFTMQSQWAWNGEETKLFRPNKLMFWLFDHSSLKTSAFAFEEKKGCC